MGTLALGAHTRSSGGLVATPHVPRWEREEVEQKVEQWRWPGMGSSDATNYMIMFMMMVMR